MSKSKKNIKWEPTLMNKHPDTIISSDYPRWKHFIPSYELQEKRPDMANLLGMEYARIWKKERDLLMPEIEKKEKKPFPKVVLAKNPNKKKEGTDKPLFKMKKFENVPSKTDSKRKK
uniref:Uncharacterized protein n=1 Tax=Clastoptera arizonana TaxID=38151 RepID=A0A1B6CVD7_9HEMI